jgi:hypothetical protein
MVNLAFELAFEDNFMVRYHKDFVSVYLTRRGITHSVCLLTTVGLPSSFDALGNIFVACVFREISVLRRHSTHTMATRYVLRQFHSCHVVSWECGVARLRESNRQVGETRR